MKKFSKGRRLYREACKIIPGGVQLLSKRPEIYLPNQWPSYYKSAKGCEILTYDNTRLYDFTNCSVGMCPLGYSNKTVNTAVIKTVKSGNTTVLNSHLEVECAKLILNFHKWAQMVRFTKSGGEAMSVAVRIARSFTGKDKVMFCGYHGWHDWYISANIENNSKLEKHLLPNVSSRGIPKALKNTSIPFEFNNPNDFELKFKKNIKNLACIILEPAKSQHPSNKFLGIIKKLSSKYKVPLIIDEITLGWHFSLGGYHKFRNLEPDIAVFSKGTTNGYPLGVIIGKKKIMSSAIDSFISSSYWSENIGFAAAIATINYMKKKNVPKMLISKGKKIKYIWNKFSKMYDVKLSISGIDSLPSFSFEDANADQKITYFTQEMLKQGFLANGTCYTMTAHTNELIHKYGLACEKVFKKISIINKKHKGNFKKFLKGPTKFVKFKNPV